MRSIMLIGLGILIGAAALGAVWAGQGSGNLDVRISAERQADGRVEVGLQQRQDDGSWTETHLPRRRYLSADAAVGRPRFSDALSLRIETRADQMAGEYRSYLLTQGGQIAGMFNDHFAAVLEPGAEPGTLLCVVDTNDAGIGAICEGVATHYQGTVERIEIAEWEGLRARLEARYADETVAGLVTTSVPTTILSLDVEQVVDRRLPQVYWIELLDQHLTTERPLFCQITHSGRLIENEQDLFWGLASEVSAAAAAQLGVTLEFSAHSDIQKQAAAIRECLSDRAAVIATTLVEPQALSPAIGEAGTAGVPVVSFNSGAEVAGQVGSALHIALDDRAAGRLAGDEFNRRGIEGAVLCIIHEPDNVGLHDRCDGFEAVYQGSVERWSAEDPAAVRDELADRLGNNDIDAILTLSVHSAWDARVTREIHDFEVQIAAFGFSVGLAQSVIDGSVMFTILDHPEMQAYLSAVASVIVERWRLDPVAYFDGMSLLIRPQIADADYMQALVDSMFDQ